MGIWCCWFCYRIVQLCNSGRLKQVYYSLQTKLDILTTTDLLPAQYRDCEICKRPYCALETCPTCLGHHQAKSVWNIYAVEMPYLTRRKAVLTFSWRPRDAEANHFHFPHLVFYQSGKVSTCPAGLGALASEDDCCLCSEFEVCGCSWGWYWGAW